MKLHGLVSKSRELKSFSEASNVPIRTWLNKYMARLKDLAKTQCDLLLVDAPLTDNEFSDFVTVKLDFEAKKRLETVFSLKEPQLTWENVTEVQLKALMIKEFGQSEPEVSMFLKCFGPKGFSKTSDQTVSQYRHNLFEWLPDFLKPVSLQELEYLREVVQKAIFYRGLDSHFIQEQLCRNANNETTMKEYFDEACKAEERYKSFESTKGKCDDLAPFSNSVSVNKMYVPSNGSRGRGRGGQGRGAVRSSHRGAANHGAPSVDPAAATTTSTNNGRGRGRKRSNKQPWTPTCHGCGVVGHIRPDCPQLSKQSSQQHAANHVEADIFDEFEQK